MSTSEIPDAAALAVVVLEHYSTMLANLKMDTPEDQLVHDQMVQLGKTCADDIAFAAGGIELTDKLAAYAHMQRVVHGIANGAVPQRFIAGLGEQ